MFPPASARGGVVGCWPGCAGAVPMTPRNGASGRVYVPLAVAVPAAASISHSSHARSSGRVSPSRFATGESGRLGATVHPHSPGVSDPTRIARVSPGRAPRTAMGPVRQWPRRPPLNIFGCSVSPGNRCRAR